VRLRFGCVSCCVSAAFPTAVSQLVFSPRTDCMQLSRSDVTELSYLLFESVQVLLFLQSACFSRPGVTRPLQARRRVGEDRRRRSERVRGLVRGLALHPLAATVGTCHGDTWSVARALHCQAVCCGCEYFFVVTRQLLEPMGCRCLSTACRLVSQCLQRRAAGRRLQLQAAFLCKPKGLLIHAESLSLGASIMPRWALLPSQPAVRLCLVSTLQECY
jgi:hypothetical protein